MPNGVDFSFFCCCGVLVSICQGTAVVTVVLAVQASKQSKAKAGAKTGKPKAVEPPEPPPIPKPWDKLSPTQMRAQLINTIEYTEQKTLDRETSEKEDYRNSSSNMHLQRDKAWLAREAQFVKSGSAG